MKKRFARLLILIAVVWCCAQSSFAQESSAPEPCQLERALAPDYGGVMLGMRLEELARMFPGSQELQTGPGADASTNTNISTSTNTNTGKSTNANTKPFVVSLGMLELGIRREEFKGVDELMLTFLGGALHRLDVRFRQPVMWKAITEFSEHASKRLAVPAGSWDAPVIDDAKQSRVLACRGFAVVVRMDKGGPSTLSIVDMAGEKDEVRAAPSAKGDAGNTPSPKTKPPPGRAKRRRRPA
jgi:hypothetical protein